MGLFCTEHAGNVPCAPCLTRLRVQAIGRHRKGKRKQGLCGWDGCQEEAAEHYYCGVHRERERARMQARRQAAKEQRRAA